MLIDCDSCAVRGVHCHECVVTVFLTLPRVADAGTAPPDEPLELDAPEQDAVGALMAAGLVPPLRLVALPAPPDPERGIA